MRLTFFLVRTETTIGWIALRFGSRIRVPGKIMCDNFSDSDFFFCGAIAR